MGGYATKEMGTRPVYKEEIPDVLAVVSELTEIPINQLNLIGSTGKDDVSNDVDIAIDVNLYPVDKTIALLSFNLTDKVKYNGGTGVASCAIPVTMPTPTNRTPDRVQVDLMFTPNVEWAKFAYHSPNKHQSKYKGAVRTILLMAVAAQINEQGVDWFQYTLDEDEEQLLVRVGRTFDLNRGLRRTCQYRPERKDKTGFLKNLRTTTLEEIKEYFPSIDVTEEDVTITNPNEALRLMFQRVTKPKQVARAEDVIRMIDNTFKADVAEEIYQKAAQRAKSVVDKMVLPPQITKYL